MLLKSLPVVSGLLSAAGAETILGVTVFSRHGDRTSKHLPGTDLTILGAQQNFQVGGDYRKRYLSSDSDKRILGISEEEVVNSQIFASAPDQTILLKTATSFLQGLYPPVGSEISSETLSNGTTYSSPLDGYQYVVIHGEESDAPDTIWLKGDDDCPAATESMDSFEMSAEYKQKKKDTKDFYESLWDGALEKDWNRTDLSYENAYTIFDYLNVAHIHNTSSARNITEEELYQLRVLADSWEFGRAFNSSDKARSMGGQTFAGAVLDQMNQTVTSQGKLKFSLLAGSYDTFLAFFGLSQLTSVSKDFYGLPDYASTMSFELFTTEDVDAFPSSTDDLRVRFLFRNGSDEGAPLRTYTLFGRGKEDSMSWAEFVSYMKDIAITSVGDWCTSCQSDTTFCAAYTNGASLGTKENDDNHDGGMSNAVAGVIGAFVTVGVFCILGAIAFFVLRRRQTARPHATPVVVPAEKQSVRSSSSGSETV